MSLNDETYKNKDSKAHKKVLFISRNDVINDFHTFLSDKAIAYDQIALKSILPLEPRKSVDVNLTIMPDDAWKAHAKVMNIKSS